MVLRCDGCQVLRHGSELMGAERRAKVIMEDDDRQLEGQMGTRHRVEIPNASGGARGIVSRNEQYEKKRIEIVSEGKRRGGKMRCCLF